MGGIDDVDDGIHFMRVNESHDLRFSRVGAPKGESPGQVRQLDDLTIQTDLALRERDGCPRKVACFGFISRNLIE